MDNDVTKEKRSEPEIPWWRPGVVVFAEVTGWIVAPLIGALYLGRYLDSRYGTTNVFFLGLTGLAFITSCVGIAVTGVKYMREAEHDAQQSKKKTEHTTDNAHHHDIS